MKVNTEELARYWGVDTFLIKETQYRHLVLKSVMSQKLNIDIKVGYQALNSLYLRNPAWRL